MLPEQFDSAVVALDEVELLRLGFRAVARLPLLTLLLVVRGSPQPGQQLTLFRQVRVDDLPAHGPAALVLAALTSRQIPHSPLFFTHLGREKRSAAEVGACPRGHGGHVQRELATQLAYGTVAFVPRL